MHGKLLSDVPVMPAHAQEHDHQQRDDQYRDPGSIQEFCDPHNQQGQPSGKGTDRIRQRF